jgi:hypothetical protein
MAARRWQARSEGRQDASTNRSSTVVRASGGHEDAADGRLGHLGRPPERLTGGGRGQADLDLPADVLADDRMGPPAAVRLRPWHPGR